MRPLKPRAALVTTLCVHLIAAAAYATPPSLLRAAPPEDWLELRREMHTYYLGERENGWRLVGTGIAALGLGGGLLASDDDAVYHAAWPVLAIAAGQVVGGALIAGASYRRIPDFDAKITNDPEAFRAAEHERLIGVRRDLRLITAVEASLAVIGAGLVASGEIGREDIVTGVGWGLALQGFVMLILDFIELDQAERYSTALAP